MKYSEAIDKLTNFLNSDLITSDFGKVQTFEPFEGCSPCIADVNPHLPKDDYGHMSGVYFLCSLDEEIYYIGKATKNNLHEEVWGKIKTPSWDDDGKQSYPKNYFLGKNLDKNVISDVERGDIRIGVLVIDNPILSSLAEVYIQTVYFQKNEETLPKLNSRIG
ncbi:MAG: hypothetical protein CR966_00045 [Pseudomonadales bacterium]|nr:MAG: hypothetical protein CR966_00045 [Pseudomonadales bacterium]